MSNPGEKPFRPFYGAGLTQFLFENDDGLDVDEIQNVVAESVNRDEPRARVIGVKVTAIPEANTLRIRVAFKVVNTSTVEEISVDLTRLR